MAERVKKLILDCDKNNASEVRDRAQTLLLDGMYVNTTVFGAIPVVQLDMQTETNKLVLLCIAAKGNTQKTQERDEQRDVVFPLIVQDFDYAVTVCGSDVNKMNQSGFPHSGDTSVHPVAPKQVIKRIVKGPDENSIKVMLEPQEGEVKFKKEARTWIVRVYDDENATEYRIGCTVTDSQNMIVRDVPLMKAQWYAVIVVNAAGSSELSGKLKHTLTDN